MVKNPPASAGDIRNVGSVPGLGRAPGGRGGNPPSVFLPGESHGQKGAWWAQSIGSQKVGHGRSDLVNGRELMNKIFLGGP